MLKICFYNYLVEKAKYGKEENRERKIYLNASTQTRQISLAECKDRWQSGEVLNIRVTVFKAQAVSKQTTTHTNNLTELGK
jgi:hypothetical protein